MKNKKRFWITAGTGAVIMIMAAVLLIMSTSRPADRFKPTIDTEKGYVSEEDKSKIVPGSHFLSNWNKDYKYWFTTDEDGTVYYYDGSLNEEGREICSDEWFVDLVRKYEPFFGGRAVNPSPVPDPEAYQEFINSYWYHLLIDTGRYEEARPFAFSPEMLAYLDELGPEPERKPAEQFSDLPEEKRLAIENAWSAVSNESLFPDTEPGPGHPRHFYMGTYGDDCQIIYSSGYPSILTATHDRVGYYVSGVWLKGHNIGFFVYKNGQWLGLNTAYALGYLSRQDLKELAVYGVCGRLIHSQVLAKQQDQKTLENAKENDFTRDTAKSASDENEDKVSSEEITVSFLLQKEEAAWFGTGNSLASDLVARFTSAQEIETFFRGKYQHMEPGDNEDLKKYWDCFVQPVIDAAKETYGEVFFKDHELLLYCVQTGTSSYQPIDYALVRSDKSVALLFSVSGPAAGQDGNGRINTDIGVFPVLLAVDKDALEGVTTFTVSPRR